MDWFCAKHNIQLASPTLEKPVTYDSFEGEIRIYIIE